MKLFKRSAFILFVCSGIGALACCMLPQTYKGSVSQDSQEALIIHANGREDLIIKVDPKIEGEGDLPYFAWIVSVPTEPDKYELADKSIFEDLFKFSTDYLAPREAFASEGADAGADPFGAPATASDEGIVLGRKVTVGPYDIQPIRGVGENAFKGLNTFMVLGPRPPLVP